MRRVALLRGVNVGGHGKVAMPALKAVLEDAGAKNVVTYIQSGNVAFSGPASLNEKRLASLIEKAFKLNVSVTVRTHAQLRAVIDDCPFDTAVTHVAFLCGKPKVHHIDVTQFEPVTYAEHGGELYLYLPQGVGRDQMIPFIDRRIGVPMTVRNWNTVTKLYELSS
jgi:uncharacterized protein (DUF1697 family)